MTWDGSSGDRSELPRAKAARGEDRRAEGTEDGSETSTARREARTTEADAARTRAPAGGERGQGAEGGSGARTGRKRPQQQRTPTPADAERPSGQRREVETYDEMKRRGPRKRKMVYLTVDGQRTGAKRDSITAGVATLERVVAQRYDWRDAGLGATRKRRQGGLFRDEEEDARGKRRR